MAKNSKKIKIDYHRIEIDNRYLSRKEIPNKTPYFAKTHIYLPPHEGGSGSVYWELPNCENLDTANQLADKLLNECDQQIAYMGGYIDGELVVKRNSKFKK